jgi:hypothetical protein
MVYQPAAGVDRRRWLEAFPRRPGRGLLSVATMSGMEMKGSPMRRTPNYRFERSEREKKKHRKKLEKLQLQAERTARRQAMRESAGDAADPADAGGPPTPRSADR